MSRVPDRLEALLSKKTGKQRRSLAEVRLGSSLILHVMRAVAREEDNAELQAGFVKAIKAFELLGVRPRQAKMILVEFMGVVLATQAADIAKGLANWVGTVSCPSCPLGDLERDGPGWRCKSCGKEAHG